ncbi:PAS domain S-box protein [Algoriphagus yeomjeoni]|uniref:PAS domain S-box protein n=1 Tax=Algoriphagus yeomjeoni TaxID=291403 RepID=UPI003CE594E4
MDHNHLLELFFQQSKDLIWMINPDYELIYANQAFFDQVKEVTGSEQKLNESIFLPGLDEETIQKWKAYYKRAINGENFEVEEHFFNPELEKIEYTHITFKPITGGNSEIVSVACQSKDITRVVKKRLEAEQMLDSSLDVFCIFNEQGQFIYVNKAAIRHWGYTPEELLGTNYSSLVFEEDVDVTDSVDASIKSGEEIKSFSNRYRKKDGGIAYNIWSSRWDEGTKLFYSVARDGKEKLAQEKKLLKSEQRFKALVTGAFDLVAVLDTEGRYLFMSPSITAIAGIPPEAFIGKNAFDFVHPDDIKQTQTELRKSIKEDRVIMKPYRAKNHENEWRWVESVLVNMLDNSAINGIVINSRDVTDKIEQKEKFEQSQRRFESLVDNSMDCTIIISAEGKTSYVSGSVKKILGYTPIEAMEMDFRDLVHPEDLAGAENALALSLEHPGVPMKGHNSRIRHKNGSWRWVEPVITNLLHDPAVGGIVDNFRDITEEVNNRKKLEESEAFSRILIESSPDCLKVLDTEGRLQYMNYNGLCQMEIDDFSAFKDKNWLALWGSENQALVKSSIEKALAGEITQFTAFSPTAKGTPKWWDVIVSPVYKESEQVQQIISVSRDVTKQKEEEHKLKLFEKVIHSTSESILITEAEPLEEPGPKIIYVNDAFCRNTGYSEEEVLGKNPRFLQGPNTEKQKLKLLGEKLKKGESAEITVVNYTKSGSEFWVNFGVSPLVDQSGKITHFISVQRDVTEQRNKELEKDFLTEVSLNFNPENDYLKSTHKLCKTISTFGKFDWVELWTLNIEKSHMRLINHYVSAKEDETFYSVGSETRSFQRSESLVGKVWSDQSQILWNDIDHQDDFLRRKAARTIGLVSVMGIPLISNNEVIGVLTVGVKKISQHLTSYTPVFERLEGYIGAELKRKMLENDLTHLFDAIPDIVTIGDFQGRFLTINKAGCELLGYTEEEILYQTFEKFIHPEDIEIAHKELARLESGQTTFNFEVRFITKSGAIIWLSWFCNTNLEEGLIYTTAKNITEEKKLRELNREVGSLAKIGSWEMDLVTKNLFWSDEIHKLYATDPESFTPSVDDAINFYREDFRQLALSNFEECINTGKSYEIEAIIVNSDNKELWVRTTAKAEFVDGSCVRVYGSFQDINERKQAEIGLKQSEAKFRTIFEIATLGIAQVDPSNGRVILVNSYYEIITGYSREEMLNMNFLELTHPDDREKDWELFSKAARSEEEYKNEKRYIKKDGSIVWVRIHLAFIRDEKGKPIRTVAICEDITEQKLAAIQLDNSLKALKDYKSALDQSSIVSVTDKEGVITYINENFCTTSKYEREEILGQTHRLINSNYHSAEFFKNLWKTIASGNIWRGEIKNKAKDGSYFWVDTTIVPFLDAKNKPIQYLAIRFDITSRKEAEESAYSALIEKNTILESISDNFYALDEDFRFSYMNASSAQLLQVDSLEIIGKNIFEKFPELLGTELEENLKKVIETKESIRFEYYHKLSNKWFQENIYPTPSGLSLYFQDITERKEAERERNSLQLTLENSLNEIYVFDSETKKFIYVNKGALDNLGYTEDEIKELTPIDLKPEYTKVTFEKLVFPLVNKEKEKIIFFTSHRRKDGSLYPVEVHLQLIAVEESQRYLAVIMDITERRKAEEEDRFKANLLSMVQQGTIATDLEGKITYWNKGAETMYGWKTEEAVGKNIMELTTPDTNREQAQQIMEMLKKGQTWTGEFEVRKKDGTQFPVLITNSPIYNENNELKGIIGISSDITQEVKNKELLKQYTKELERSNEELEQFAFVTSHDLQEPLRMISSFMDQLKRKYENELDEKALQYIYFASDGARRMKNIILDLLEYSRASKPTEDLGEVNLNEVIASYKQLRRKVIEESSAVILAEDMPSIFSYNAVLVQIFHGLLDNAIKYSREGIAPVIEIKVKENENEWEFSVSDNGIGIDEQFFDKIFIIFQRLHNRDKHDGTGIGLSVVKRSVEFLGGQIWLNSTVGEGTTFFFTIAKNKNKKSIEI